MIEQGTQTEEQANSFGPKATYDESTHISTKPDILQEFIQVDVSNK